MENNVNVKEEVYKQRWISRMPGMNVFVLEYNDKQEHIIEAFREYCRLHGYNRVAGLHTLLDLVEYNKSLTVMADKILDLNKEVAELRMKIEKAESGGKTPKGMGAGVNTPKQKNP